MEPRIYLGTCAFTASGWSGAFYPKGMKASEYLSFYSERFDTVEIDSTFYGCPAPKTVTNWCDKTSSNFVFSVKAPQAITHEKILVGCQEEFATFVKTMDLLGDKLGPIVLQFPHFDKYQLKDRHTFTDRLLPFLKTLPSGRQFALEIRNRKWLDAEFADILRSFNVALVVQDIHTMPGPAEMNFDPVTADFSYVRLLGNRKQIEMATTVWEKTVEDKTEQVSAWVSYCQSVQRRGVKQYVYANNHYEGFGPGTVEKFGDLWKKAGGADLRKPTREPLEPNLFG
ncbi:MAG TPA: DUF72 domain-containing protein [Candidatus Acidoferrum sp.]|nr:DUF72 domain-containing protein [Candidatus Acidoferrum sp.]